MTYGACSCPPRSSCGAGLCQGRWVSNPGQPHVVVVGAGIAGLAAAFFLRDVPCRVTVLDGSPRLGGKLAVSEIAGVAVDEGAEALLARRPEGTGLAAAAGLAGQLAWPGTTAARVWSRGRMRPLPRRQFMGVPADLTELAASGLVSPAGVARARQDLDRPATGRDGDVPVAGFVAARFGQEVVDRLVDPLLAGVYAGRAEELSFEATLPALAAESGRHASLAAAVAALLPGPAGDDGPAAPGTGPPPVFTTLAAGLGTLPGAVAAASGACARTSAMVRGLARAAGGWRLTVGSAHDEEYLLADAVVLAAPAAPVARLLAGVPGASAAVTALGEIRYASMAIVTLAYPAAAFPGPLEGSGYLVPAVDGRPVKAVTFSTVKWPHLRDAAAGLVIVRCSLATGAPRAPVASRVTRWGGGLPQYTVGHLDRVARIRAAVAGQAGLAVCGAAYDGIGIPACVASARAAAGQIAVYLGNGRQWERRVTLGRD